VLRTGRCLGNETRAMVALADLVAAAHGSFVPRLARAILGTDDAVSVAEAITDAVAAALAVPVVGARFYEPGVGIVVGLELADGRAVVAKIHRADVLPVEAHRARAGVQAALADAGVPAPRPLAGPLVLGTGWLLVEELRAGGDADGDDPVVRRAMAAALHRFVEAGRTLVGRPWVVPWLAEPTIDGVWYRPHDLRFDFPGTRAGAEWIDAAARGARSTLDATALPPVLGHLDWRVQNLGFDGVDVVAIYDWDSVAAVPEPALLGSASVIHPLDWRTFRSDPLPTLEQLDGFVADYESSRGEPFTAAERVVLAASQVWVAAYGARCQHSDDVLRIFPEVDPVLGWPRLLRELLAR
jgi:hypothetical protein